MGRMTYITLADMNAAIRRNLWKIPRDIDYIVGIPRSGMIAASIISSYLNVPLTDTRSLVAGLEPYGGRRLKYFSSRHTGRALVVDDTVWNGGAKNETKKMLSGVQGVELIYMCVYLEGRGEDAVDIWLEDVRQCTDNYKQPVLYEWNIMQHHPKLMSRCLYDLDGVMCPDPPDERDEQRYLDYIADAPPLFIPRTPIGGIITYRLQRNRAVTERWLHSQGVQFGELIMFDSDTFKRGVSPEQYKGDYYRMHRNYELFVESSDKQARRIAEIAGKAVYCVGTNKVYQK